VIANALLILRFSSTRKWWWRHATSWSLFCWIGTLVVGAVNLAIFGAKVRNSPGYEFTEGFWSAVVSFADVAVITLALIFHYIFAYGKGKADETEVRLEGKKFMLSVTFFMVIIAFQSLAYNQLEDWKYSDAIYFSIQWYVPPTPSRHSSFLSLISNFSALTIGYGDLVPTTTWSKILVFPFSILTISQLGNEIALILGFIRDRAEARRDKWRRIYEGAMHEEANRMRPQANLIQEMALIHEINKREET
jgi:potassium channel subfamily K